MRLFCPAGKLGRAYRPLPVIPLVVGWVLGRIAGLALGWPGSGTGVTPLCHVTRAPEGVTAATSEAGTGLRAANLPW